MGDLTRGETFAAGETVTHTRLNNLVDGAVIKPAAVTSTHIAPQAVKSEHLDPTLGFGASQMSITTGTLLGGGAANVGAEITPDAAEFEITAGTLSLKTGGIAEGKLAGSISAAKLAGGIDSTKLSAVGTAGTYGSATLTPVITTDAAGRVTGVTTATTNPAMTELQGAIPASGGTTVIALGAVPADFDVVLRCLVNDGDFQAGDMTPLWFAVNSDASQVLSWFLRGSTLTVIRHTTSNLRVLGPDGSRVDITPANWRVEVRKR